MLLRYSDSIGIAQGSWNPNWSKLFSGLTRIQSNYNKLQLQTPIFRGSGETKRSKEGEDWPANSREVRGFEKGGDGGRVWFFPESIAVESPEQPGPNQSSPILINWNNLDMIVSFCSIWFHLFLVFYIHVSSCISWGRWHVVSPTKLDQNHSKPIKMRQVLKGILFVSWKNAVQHWEVIRNEIETFFETTFHHMDMEGVWSSFATASKFWCSSRQSSARDPHLSSSMFGTILWARGLTPINSASTFCSFSLIPWM